MGIQGAGQGARKGEIESEVWLLTKLNAGATTNLPSI